MNTLELFYEPRKIIMPKLDNPYGEPEMSEFESAFLCGCLKKHHPKKILELGIAGGATTAIILQCMSMISSNYILHSVDLSEKFYRDKNKQSGFLAKESYQYLTEVNHKFHLGQYITECLDEIGNEIDFLILDTAQRPPGEMLDFLAAFPYLSKDAVVVLHDINRCHECTTAQCDAYAKKLLFDVIKAEKYMNKDENKKNMFPNIAAFQVNSSTSENISDCFSAMTIPWLCMPDDSVLEGYKKIYEKFYSEECLYFFSCAVKANKDTMKRMGKLKSKMWRICRILKSEGFMV